MHASTDSAAPTHGQAPGTNVTSHKRLEALWKSIPACVEAVLKVKG